jgi:hypothetical protein
MGTMICNNCGRPGMYWKDLCDLSPWTFCPNCNSRQLPTPEEREPEEEPEEETEAAISKARGEIK